MKQLKIIHFLVALLLTSAVAHAWDPVNPVFPTGITTFNGNGNRTSGVVQTYNIPLTDHPDSIYFYVRGADGGNADAGPNSNKDKFQGKGGGGAVATATFQIAASGTALRPGGEIRIIVGNKGTHKQGSSGGTKVAAGGGGGSGVIYKGPEANADWIPLIIAGGGGGGMTSSYSTGVIRANGGNGQIGTSGSNNSGGAGTHGREGLSFTNRGEGGGGWTGEAFYGAGKGNPSGGSGGLSRHSDRTSSGGFGCGAGGGAGGEKVGTVTTVGGGGGGGYSGGGGGSTSQAGGGGGSIIDDLALDDSTKTLTGRAGTRYPGYISMEASAVTVPDANAKPIITLVGGSSHDIAYSTTASYIDPGYSATDFYNNPISVQVISNTVNRALPAQYQVIYEATDQFGQTAQAIRTVTVTEPFTSPKFVMGTDPLILGTEVEYDELDTNLYPGTVLSEGSTGLLYILSGVDAEKFTLEEDTGELLFKEQPDFEAPSDFNSDNTYEITVTASGSGRAIGSDLTVSVLDHEELPTVPELDNNSTPENQTFVGSVSSTDGDGTAVVYSISPTVGADRALFSIHPTNGALSFLSAPDYETPTDQGQDNVYEIQVLATSGGDTTVQLFNISVTNVDWTWSIGDFRAEFALNPDGSDDLKDQSNNGIANIHYFLLGLGDPSNANPPVLGGGNSLGLPQLFQDPGNKQAYVYTVRRNPVGYTVVPEVSDDLTAWSNPFGDSPSFTPIEVEVFPMDAYYNVYVLSYLSGSNAEYPDATIYPKLFFRVNASKND